MGLATLVITDAGSTSQLAWLGGGVALLLLAVGLVSGSFTAIHASIALLGALFLLRHGVRLVLAPPYGAGMLLVEDLAAQTIELRGVSRLGRPVIGTRTSAALAAAAVGGCASAAAALVVTVAPGRSVAMTALGALAAVGAFAAILRTARRRYGPSTATQPAGTARYIASSEQYGDGVRRAPAAEPPRG